MSIVWLQVESIEMHPEAGSSPVRPKFQLVFFDAQQRIIGQYPKFGTQEVLGGQEWAPRGGLFNRILTYDDTIDFRTVQLFVQAHDATNPEGQTCIQPQGGAKPYCFPNPSMSLCWAHVVPRGKIVPVNGHAPDFNMDGISTSLSGENYNEHFSLRFFAWGDPPLVPIGGRIHTE